MQNNNVDRMLHKAKLIQAAAARNLSPRDYQQVILNNILSWGGVKPANWFFVKGIPYLLTMATPIPKGFALEWTNHIVNEVTGKLIKKPRK